MSEASPNCIECGGANHPIRVVDGRWKQHPLKYAAIDSQPSWFFGMYPVEGYLAAELCESCGRVTFRAVPKEHGEK